MYWTITLGWSILGTIAFWLTLSKKWNRLDHFHRVMIQQIRILHPIPGTEGYLDLKFSVLRHAIVFLISALLMAWMRSRFITSIITFLNLMYCWFPIVRYRSRKKEVIDTVNAGSKELAAFMSIPVRDSFCSVIHAIISVILLYILMLVKPNGAKSHQSIFTWQDAPTFIGFFAVMFFVLSWIVSIAADSESDNNIAKLMRYAAYLLSFIWVLFMIFN